MIGTKTAATQNMISSVSSLEEASQSVRLLARLLEEGITNGKSVNPVIKIIDAIPSELSMNAKPDLDALAIKLVSTGSVMELITRTQSSG